MTYLLLDLAFLVPVALVAVAALAVRRSPRWRAIAVAAVALLVTTVVFDNVIVGLGIVAYDPSRILGIRMPIAPIEDLSYSIAAVVLLPSVWALLGTRRGASTGPAGLRQAQPSEDGRSAGLRQAQPAEDGRSSEDGRSAADGGLDA